MLKNNLLQYNCIYQINDYICQVITKWGKPDIMT